MTDGEAAKCVVCGGKLVEDTETIHEASGITHWLHSIWCSNCGVMYRFGKKRPSPANDTRHQVLWEVQQYINTHDIYYVLFEHYDEKRAWVPLQTRRINIAEALNEGRRLVISAGMEGGE